MAVFKTNEFIRPNLVDFDGLPMPVKFYTLEKFREATKFIPGKDDVMICTYPKSGTTWMQYIVWEIIKNSSLNDLHSSGDKTNIEQPKSQPHVHQMWFEISKQLELYGNDDVMKMNPPRIIKTHNPANYMTLSDSGKYINVYRNPWDTTISYFHNLKEEPALFGFVGGTEYDAIECFIENYLPWGDYFKHIKSWFELSNRPNVLLISYEELKTQPRESILKVAKFLDEKYESILLANNEQRLKDIVNRTSFDTMKNLRFVLPDSADISVDQLVVKENEDKIDHHEQKFFFRGTFNYGMKYFNDNQRERMLARIRTELSSYPEILEKWKSFDVAV